MDYPRDHYDHCYGAIIEAAALYGDNERIGPAVSKMTHYVKDHFERAAQLLVDREEYVKAMKLADFAMEQGYMGSSTVGYWGSTQVRIARNVLKKDSTQIEMVREALGKAISRGGIGDYDLEQVLDMITEHPELDPDGHFTLRILQAGFEQNRSIIAHHGHRVILRKLREIIMARVKDIDPSLRRITDVYKRVNGALPAPDKEGSIASPPVNSEEITTGVHNVYERIAPKYAQTWGDEVQQEVVVHREKLLKEIPQGAMVVDLGTGPGRDVAWFKNHGLRTIGVDSSEAMLEQARMLYPDLDFRRMDLSNLQFNSATVDALWDNATFHHLPPELARVTVREFNRILKSNGILFLRVKRGNGEESQKDPNYPDELRYFKLYEREELVNLLISNGFEIIDSGTQPDSSTSKQPARDIEWVYVFARKSTSASPVNTTEGMGGIDFRALPIVTQAMTNLKLSSSSAMSMSKLQNINLNQELGDIQKMVEAGMTPSTDRIKEYVASSCLKGDLDAKRVVSCIANILRLEEEHCVSTDPMLRDILVVLESNRSMENLRAIFIGTKS